MPSVFTLPVFQAYPFARRTQPAPVKFGCRVFAYITPKPEPGQDEFIKQCLTTGLNSMKRQNQLPLWTEGSKDPKVAAEHYHEDVGPDAFAYKAGWGVAANKQDADALEVTKSPKPTWQDDSYDKAVGAIAEQHPTVVMTHLREARNQIAHLPEVAENAHPFKIGDWALMQHGCLPDETAAQLEETLKKKHAMDERVPLPKGEVDSERVACYVAEKIREKTGSVNVKDLETDQLANLFQEAVSEVIRWPDPEGKTHQPEGYEGAFNLVLSDGKRIVASRYSALRPLYLGSHQTPSSNTEYLLATDKMQPTDESGLAKVDWALLPHNSVTVLEPVGPDAQHRIIQVRDPATLVTKPVTKNQE